MTGARRRSSRRWPIRLVTAAAAWVLLILTLPGPAAAHTTLIGTDPVDGAVLAESPGQAALTFDGAVSLPPKGVQVFDARGEPVPTSASARGAVVTVDLPERLANGTYVVAWRIIAADGHPITGSLTFSVGKPSPRVTSPAPPAGGGSAVTIALSAAQAVGYLGLLLAVGLGIFTVLVLPARARAHRPRHRMRQLMTAAATASAVAALLGLPLTAIDQQGLSLAHVLSPRAWTGITAGAITSFAILAVGLAALRVAVGLRLASHPTRVALGLGVFPAAVAPALTGHSRAYEPELPVILVDFLHVVAGSVWFGGLVGLALTLPAIGGHSTDAARTLSRFSVLAAGVLAVLVGTGSLLAWRILGSWENLFGTTYGWLLLIKIALVAVAASIAAWNRYILLPAAQQAAALRGVRGLGPDVAHREQRVRAVQLGRVVSVEALVIVLVLVLTGFLVNRSPRAETQETPYGNASASARLGEDVKVLATLTPARVGQNALTIQLQNPTGEPLEPTRPPVISLDSDELELGRIQTSSDSAGNFHADVIIPSTGTWRLQVSLRLGQFENPVGTVDFTVRE